METAKRYNCPELCTVFCANDITTFQGYRPNIIFERQGTIGQGQKVCDFHLKNGKLKSHN
ncbi:L-2-amino-thiazoline-4-carboxylic acid hydrolase [Clostridium coskatii]|uniref:L-2-amino-thiazoline-4-carboxylic acid hydrolase n=1 Tax=Clostridium coskatii TaxID=1705578 RepID=UPI0009EE5873